MTREERKQQRRREQILQAKRRYRQRQRERKQTPAPVTPLQAPGPQKDPVWGDDPVPAAPQARPEPAHAPVVPPEPEEPVVPKELPYVRRAARAKAPKGVVGPRRGGESAKSWRSGSDPQPADPLASVDDWWGDW
jgi:hypothetical protein